MLRLSGHPPPPPLPSQHQQPPLVLSRRHVILSAPKRTSNPILCPSTISPTECCHQRASKVLDGPKTLLLSLTYGRLSISNLTGTVRLDPAWFVQLIDYMCSTPAMHLLQRRADAEKKSHFLPAARLRTPPVFYCQAPLQVLSAGPLSNY